VLVVVVTVLVLLLLLHVLLLALAVLVVLVALVALVSVVMVVMVVMVVVVGGLVGGWVVRARQPCLYSDQEKDKAIFLKTNMINRMPRAHARARLARRPASCVRGSARARATAGLPVVSVWYCCGERKLSLRPQQTRPCRGGWRRVIGRLGVVEIRTRRAS